MILTKKIYCTHKGQGVMKIKLLEDKELFNIQDVVVATKSSVVEYVKYSSKRRKEKEVKNDKKVRNLANRNFRKRNMKGREGKIIIETIEGFF